MNKNYKRMGYLSSDYKAFYLIDEKKKEFECHYHDFHKVLIFLNGNVSYYIEGKTYNLKPFDIILVKASDIHRPIIHDKTPYERIIIYVSQEYLESFTENNDSIAKCMNKASEKNTNLVRIEDILNTQIYNVILDLKNSLNSNRFAEEIYRKVKFIEFIILLNRVINDNGKVFKDAETSNKKILNVLEYINDNLAEDISISKIADDNYLNRSYLMHLFKSETGYSIMQYITEKRLYIANKLIQNGESVTSACYQAGFSSYTSFFRSYKKKFNNSPGKNK